LALLAGATPSDLFEPGLVSTPATEVRLAISPDGRRMLWGVIGQPDDANGWEIYESVRRPAGWSRPAPAAFNSAANDFDPAFSGDGSTVYFFSNRPGGLGSDDIWSVRLDPTTGRYGRPQNLGPAVNSAGADWAPAPSPDGRSLIFSSDGRGGRGGQDLFVAARTRRGWATAASLGPAVNTAADEFDATYIDDGRGLVFTRGDLDAGRTRLHVAWTNGAGFEPAGELPPRVNCSPDINNGPAVSPARPDRFFWSARCASGAGRMDIRSAPIGDVVGQRAATSAL